jgi:hypothetical protein
VSNTGAADESVATTVNVLDQLDRAYPYNLVAELREMGLKVKVVGEDESEPWPPCTYQEFKVFVPIADDDPAEALAQKVVIMVIARYWDCGYSLEHNTKFPAFNGEGGVRNMTFKRTAPMTLRRHLE